MKSDPNSDLNREVMASSEPLALMRADGTIQAINAAMQRQLPDGVLSSDTIRKLFADPPGRLTRIQGNGASESNWQLLRISLGDQFLISLVEQPQNQQVEKLRRELVKAEKSSVTDRLTGLWNRHQFENQVDRERAGALRHGHPVTLLVMDIDHFKSLNDDHGHAEGDRVLVELAAMLSAELRAIDSLYRWGGEEFVLLAPNTGVTGAKVIAERLRKHAATADFGVGRPVTISLGAATLEAGESTEDWFKRADDALYTAKQDGRNRTALAPAVNPWPTQSQNDDPILMPWLPRYESGHELIDAQHKRLFELANNLITASIDPNTTSDELTSRLDALIEHAKLHFSDEEALLERIGYENLEAHRRSHRALAKKVGTLRSRVVAGTGSHAELQHFLVNVLIREHLMTVDTYFFPYLHQGA